MAYITTPSWDIGVGKNIIIKFNVSKACYVNPNIWVYQYSPSSSTINDAKSTMTFSDAIYMSTRDYNMNFYQNDDVTLDKFVPGYWIALIYVYNSSGTLLENYQLGPIRISSTTKPSTPTISSLSISGKSILCVIPRDLYSTNVTMTYWKSNNSNQKYTTNASTEGTWYNDSIYIYGSLPDMASATYQVQVTLKNSSYETSSSIRNLTYTAPVLTISPTSSSLGTYSMSAPSRPPVTINNASYEQIRISYYLDSITDANYLAGSTYNNYNTLQFSSSYNPFSNKKWLSVTNGSHTLICYAETESGRNVTGRYSFTKKVTTMDFITSRSMTGNKSAMPKYCKIKINGYFPSGTTLHVYVCNNGNDSSPTWEEITAYALSGEIYKFTNKTKSSTYWNLKLKVGFNKNTVTSTCYITSITGAYK